jgi:hypothetical protein
VARASIEPNQNDRRVFGVRGIGASPEKAGQADARHPGDTQLKKAPTIDSVAVSTRWTNIETKHVESPAKCAIVEGNTLGVRHAFAARLIEFGDNQVTKAAKSCHPCLLGIEGRL